MTEPVVLPEDDFDKAFAEAANAAELPEPVVVEPAVAAPAAVVPEPVVVAPVVVAPEPVVAAPAVVALEPVAVAPAVVVPAPVVATSATVVAPAATVAPPAHVEETAEQKTKREEFEKSIAPYAPTDEEKAALAKFKDDFPNEFAAVEAKLKGVDRDINARVYKAVQSVLQQVYKDVTPIAEGFQASSVREHFTEIRRNHADYDAVVPLIPEWIKKQPSYLQPAMQAVYDSGDTASVVALVADYKKATGSTPAPAAAVIPAVAVVTRPADADDLTPVGSKRTAPTPKGQPDPNDFDAAFNEAAAL